jgi:hypothetical protein
MRFLAMTNHFVYEPDFCNPATGWEKGLVEKNVRGARHQMLQCMPDFPDLAALNAWLEQRCLKLWRETPHGKQPGTIADVWVEEQAALMPLPVAFDGFIELSKRVSAEAESSLNHPETCPRVGDLPCGNPSCPARSLCALIFMVAFCGHKGRLWRVSSAAVFARFASCLPPIPL